MLGHVKKGITCSQPHEHDGVTAGGRIKVTGSWQSGKQRTLLTFIYSRAIPPIHNTWQKADGIYYHFVIFSLAIF